MCVGGSGLNLMMHVRFMVLPLSTYRSGPPRIVAVGTAKKELSLSIDERNSRNRFQSRRTGLNSTKRARFLSSSTCLPGLPTACVICASPAHTMSSPWPSLSQLIGMPTPDSQTARAIRLFVAAATYATIAIVPAPPTVG